MLSQVARFELKYQLRSPVVWITSVVFFLFAYTVVTSDALRIGWGGYVVRNSPYTTAFICLLMGVFSIFIATSFVSNVVLRDDETNFGPIVRSTRLSKFDYLFGRFVGAFAASSLVFASVPLGAWIGAAMPWHDPGTIGPFRPGTYLYVYAVLCLPVLFALAAVFFTLATTTRSMLTTYLVALVVLMAYLLGAKYFARSEFKDVAALLDPFGLRALSLATEHWTPSERNSLLPPFLGPFARNRLLWTAISFGLLALVWYRFRPELVRGKTGRPLEDASTSRSAGAAPTTLPPPAGDVRAIGWGPLVALTKFDVRSVLRSPAYVLLLGIAFVNSVVGLWIAGDDSVSITLPVTRLMVKTLLEQFTLIPLVIAAYYAGELVWRDRERRVNEIVDATPSADWAFVIPKVVAIAVVLATMAVIIVGGAIGVQLLKGYTALEMGHYLGWFALPWLINMMLYAVLAVFIQMVVPHKFGGFLVTMLVLAGQQSLAKLGLEHNLAQFAGTSAVPLSDMNGQGTYAGHAAWFRVYWMAFAVLLGILAYALWRRGASSPLRARLRRLPTQLRGPAAWIGAAALFAMAGVGGFIFYNTNVVNEYRTATQSARWAAGYEKALIGFKDLPQPRITDITLNVDIYPREPRVVSRGVFVVENKTGAPLREVHLGWARALEQKSFLGTLYVADLDMRALEVVGARMTRDFADLHYRIFSFDQPLAPGQRTEIRFEAVSAQRGFRNTNNETRVVANGTFLDSFRIAPWLGFNGFLTLDDRTLRRKFGLPDERRPPPLEDENGRAFNYFRHDSDWINLDMTVSTDADQALVATGYLVDSTVANGRRVARFKTDAPILNFYSIQSARYAVRQDRWNDVSLAVYHHPAHAFNVDRLMGAMKASLDYFATNFSPYQFRQLRIVEFPAYSNFAQAFPGTVPTSEAAGFILDLSDSERVDGVTYVTAHETGHQWWAHQVIGADMQGQTVLSETLAQYAALMVMERIHGHAEIRRFLKGSLDSYLRSRGTDVLGEVPLERVEGQAHIRYQKGGMVMYLLKDLMGEDAVNRALRSLVQAYGLKGPPYPTSRDLIQRLRAEAKPEHQELISDLFEKTTVYDLKASNAVATHLEDGRWSVSIEVEAKKFYADAKGAETEAALDGTFDVGVFTAEPGNPGFAEANVLSLERQRIVGGRHTLTVVVDQEPTFVGLDPYNKYVDRNSGDNVRAVTIAARPR